MHLTTKGLSHSDRYIVIILHIVPLFNHDLFSMILSMWNDSAGISYVLLIRRDTTFLVTVHGIFKRPEAKKILNRQKQGFHFLLRCK